MEFSFSDLHWPAVVAAIVAGQVISTVWFVALFGRPWAEEYGVASRQEHTAQIPGFTYGVQVACTAAQMIGLALLARWLGVESVAGALALGLFVTISFCLANGVPGQAFLRRWRVAAIAYGCQTAMIVVGSLVVCLWR